MRFYLQMPPAENQPPRFYHLLIQKDLLGGYNLVREWGAQGRPGITRRDHFENRDAAVEALVAARDRQIARGYRVMFRESDSE